MNGHTLPKIFIFNENIDAGYLYSLYADDYQYIEEVFAITLQQYNEDLNALHQAWAAEAVADLKRGIHKIKPAFGFVGLLDVQEQCAAFEDLCQRASGTAALAGPYQQIITTLAVSKTLLESEYLKLKEFNGTPL
ncbi:MAG: Hpt domain-containing protein [Candidatus Pseudobacter hemicellulosilyticus]|uniref:Hpt domain-containing protein n=1 Tax=Candidatus Pseudobacter hemicellulosilyticus TaxID=3121375 RepID=A0AAJ5WPT4_9BACT|nr:MAG: Hpt domain-containing protein [Pseudobacter sp.]